MIFQAKVVFPIVLAIVVVIFATLLITNESHIASFDDNVEVDIDSNDQEISLVVTDLVELTDDFEIDYKDNFDIKSANELIMKYCSVEIISYLTENSNIFNQTAYNFEWINAPDNISENEFSSCIHEIEEILYPTIDKPTPMDDNTETDFTETCHFIPDTIHANFTDGKVITTTDDCN